MSGQRDGRRDGRRDTGTHFSTVSDKVPSLFYPTTTTGELTAFGVRLRVLVEVLDAARVEGAGATHDAVDLREEQGGTTRSVLTRHVKFCC